MEVRPDQCQPILCVEFDGIQWGVRRNPIVAPGSLSSKLISRSATWIKQTYLFSSPRQYTGVDRGTAALEASRQGIKLVLVDMHSVNLIG